MKGVVWLIELLLVAILTAWATGVLGNWAVDDVPGLQSLRSLAVLVLIHSVVATVGGMLAGILLRGTRWHPLVLVLPLFLLGLLPSLGDATHWMMFARYMFLLMVSCGSFWIGLRISRSAREEGPETRLG